jgi:hypothetical protein
MAIEEMKIKAGDRILNLSAPWSGKVRSMSKKWLIVDIPTYEPVVVRRCRIKYNNEIRSWEVVNVK